MQSISTLISEQFSQLQPYKAGLTTEAIQEQYGLEQVHKFASNESPFPPSELAMQAVAEAMHSSNRYPDYQKLRSVIGEQFQLSASNVILGCGSINILDIIFHAFNRKDSNAVFTTCSYFAYPLLAQKSGIDVKLAQTDENLGHIAHNLLAQCDENTSLLVIDNPSNFSGSALDAKELEYILSNVPKHTLVVLDQAYEEFTDAAPLSIHSQTFADHPNLIVTRTFSKAYSLAALRIGYALANSEIIDWLNRGQQPFPVSNLGIAAAIASLQDKAYSDMVINSVKQGRKSLADGLNQLGLKCYPSHSNFVLVEFGENAGNIYQKLLEMGYITRQMQVYKRPDLIRISVGNNEENAKLLNALKTLLNP
ncbi:histidinol-phosphate transaminase [Pseudoalteromonas luteoviolacea]|uniref:histidinol-phosphate transaminase n=1 Tax=Pseudoalteromonas luteoviolacea TaxID=43657 RepID=UPI001EED62D7|nr:histidinol-phosphate transaminase [Pseudoalteromonas luteoviolacea]MCF6442647.1 histidinol-phosphate transaminase [Pseudoalteromonas luteoviolacea]